MTNALAHRGPDGNGYHTDGPVALGHRRLAIIDLAGGAQPISNEDGTVWVTFNGEIYNYQELRTELIAAGHQFRSNSDTEVLVHAYEQWGRDCLNRLRGMFGLAFWDANLRQLILARDRMGIKPLVYMQDGSRFAFASELQALRALGATAWTTDLAALDLYLHFQYIAAPFTIYRGVHKLLPAHMMVVHADGRVEAPSRYWQLQLEPDTARSEQDWLECLDESLRESTALHLRSDVTFGAFLSGGIDSSTIVAYMGQLLHQPVKTFTIGYAEQEYDERKEAAYVADCVQTDHHEQVVHPNAVHILPELVRHYGEPFADSSAIPTWYVSQVARQHVKMVLSGDGGDESFAGYSSYAYIEWCHRRPVGMLETARHFAGNVLRRLGVRPQLPTPRDTWYGRGSYFSLARREPLWQPEFHHWMGGTRQWFDEQIAAAPTVDLATTYQHFDLHNYLTYDNLTKVDIASMYHGLEVRVPLLDHVLLEKVARLPASLKLHPIDSVRYADRSSTKQPLQDIVRKYILRRNGERFFSNEFLYRRKMGFEVPVRLWFRQQDSRLAALLEQPSDQFCRLFQLPYVYRLLEEHRAGTDHAWRLWSLVFLEEWFRQNQDVDIDAGDLAPVRWKNGADR